MREAAYGFLAFVVLALVGTLAFSTCEPVHTPARNASLILELSQGGDH